jgi:hypothetical protein
VRLRKQNCASANKGREMVAPHNAGEALFRLHFWPFGDEVDA